MNTIDDVWQELFGREITDRERSVMERIAEYTDGNESTFVSSAVIVHFLYTVLLLDRDSPLQISARASSTLLELRKKIDALIRVTDMTQYNVSMLQARSRKVLEAFDAAEKFAKWQRNNRITVYEKNEHPFHREFSISLDVVGIFLAACIASSIFGAMVAGGIALMVLAG